VSEFHSDFPSLEEHVCELQLVVLLLLLLPDSVTQIVDVVAVIRLWQ